MPTEIAVPAHEIAARYVEDFVQQYGKLPGRNAMRRELYPGVSRDVVDRVWREKRAILDPDASNEEEGEEMPADEIVHARLDRIEDTQTAAYLAIEQRLSRAEALIRALTRQCEQQALTLATQQEILERVAAFVQPFQEMCALASSGEARDNRLWQGLGNLRAVMESGNPEANSWGRLFAQLCHRPLPKNQ